MATRAFGASGRDDGRLFFYLPLAMTATVVIAFSLQLAMGRSTFASPAILHAHAVIAMGWMAIFTVQGWLGSSGPIALHRRLGWIAAGWALALALVATAVSVWNVQSGRVPFFFIPQHFLIANPLTVLSFLAMTVAAIRLRKRTDWHRRLHIGATCAIMGPAFGRLLPAPLLMPWVFQIASACGVIFVLIGMIADRRRQGRIHPAWWWGVAAVFGPLILAEAIAYTPVGGAIYAWVTAGIANPLPPLDYPPPPPGF